MLHFLGDSAYPLSPWLMTIYSDRNRELTPIQQQFNRLIIQTRQIIERCIGVLKMRFRCLLSERKLKYHPKIAGEIINTCVVLHNFLSYNRFDLMHGIDFANFERADNVNIPHQHNRRQIEIRMAGENRRQIIAEDLEREQNNE